MAFTMHCNTFSHCAALNYTYYNNNNNNNNTLSVTIFDNSNSQQIGK